MHTSNSHFDRQQQFLPRQSRDQTPPAREIRVSGANRCDKIELEEFVRTLKDIVFAEREVESAKIELALKSDFNLVDAFKMFDLRSIGAVSQSDLRTGLAQSLGFMDFTNDDIYLLYRRFDKMNTGQLSFQEFSRVMLPFSREYASLIKDRIEFYSRRGGHPS